MVLNEKKAVTFLDILIDVTSVYQDVVKLTIAPL